MTCHNTHRGLCNDAVIPDLVGTSESARVPHGGAQGDVLMGQNAYFVAVGDRGNHSMTANVEHLRNERRVVDPQAAVVLD